MLAKDWIRASFYELISSIHAVTATIDLLNWHASRVNVATQTLLECFLEATKVSAALSDSESTVVVKNVGISTGAVKLVFYRACVSEFSHAYSLEPVAISLFTTFFKHLENIILWVVHRARLERRRNLVHHCKAPIIRRDVSVTTMPLHNVTFFITSSVVSFC